MVRIRFKSRPDAVRGFYILTFNGGFVGLPDYVCLVKKEQLDDLKSQGVKFRVLKDVEPNEGKKVRDSVATPV